MASGRFLHEPLSAYLGPLLSPAHGLMLLSPLECPPPSSPLPCALPCILRTHSPAPTPDSPSSTHPRYLHSIYWAEHIRGILKTSLLYWLLNKLPDRGSQV